MSLIFGEFSLKTQRPSCPLFKFTAALPIKEVEIKQRNFTAGKIFAAQHENNRVIQDEYEDALVYVKILGLAEQKLQEKLGGPAMSIAKSYLADRDYITSDHLRGYFQFILVDKVLNKLILYVCPFSGPAFYYTEVDGVLYFSNNTQILKRCVDHNFLPSQKYKKEYTEALTQILKKPRNFMWDLLDYFGLVRRLLRSIFPEKKKKPEGLNQSYFEGIYRLTAGIILEYDSVLNLKGELYEFKKPAVGLNIENPVTTLRAVVRKAIRNAINATKGEVGILMSAGLDSTFIAALAAQELGTRPLYVFSSLPDKTENMPAYRHYTLREENLIRALCDAYPNMKFMPLYDSQKKYSITDIPYFSKEFGDGPDLLPLHATWLLTFMEWANDLNIGTLLVGSMGNFTISWGGCPIKKNHFLKMLQIFRNFLRNKYCFFRHIDLSQSAGLNSALTMVESATSLYLTAPIFKNLNLIDITIDPNVVETCLCISKKYYALNNLYRGLMRAMMNGVVLDEIRLATQRGLQNSDFLAQYNQVYESLKEMMLSHEEMKNIEINWDNKNSVHEIEARGRFLYKIFSFLKEMDGGAID